MADGLAVLRKKIRISVQGYLNRQGIRMLGEDPEYIGLAIARALNVKDSVLLEKIWEKTAYMNCFLTTNKTSHNDWCTEDEGTEAICWHRFKKPRAYMMRWKMFFGQFFDMFDENNDGYIEEKEFAIFYESIYISCRRADHADFITRAFKVVDKENTGKITKKQYVNAYLTYFSDPDVSYEELPLF